VGLDDYYAACEAIGSEHVALMVAEPDEMAARLTNYGALFLGDTPVALGDYGAGPNHVLPTGGTSRWAGGLSVLAFLRMRTWLRVDAPAAAGELAEDTAWLARAEGLEGHARAVGADREPCQPPRSRRYNRARLRWNGDGS
jgi:phosphoribosyl-ATP pyrophosphohydrolase/phosphoribosyl-AMP cyclohydrolase/histidinol dehydrogenase